MIEKKAVQVKLGTIEVILAPVAFDRTDVPLDTLGNNAENIDELLYIKKPKNGFPKI